MSKQKRKQQSLRVWQEEAVELAIRKFRNGDHHFMCVAAPGSGKTQFSAEVARRLLELGLIDFVICLAPSISVQQGIKKTFSLTLNDRMDGVIGSLGWVLTYQAVPYCYEKLRYLVQNYRVLMISDEVHHCAFEAQQQGNQWGTFLESLSELSSVYTLTLSGTPWRTDKTRIALQSYSGEPMELEIDYVYGLGQAVSDKVCRSPSLILLDNDSICVNKSNASAFKFSSLESAISSGHLKYQDLLVHESSLLQLLSFARDELLNYRELHASAAGLVVASSVAQAHRIASHITDKYQQKAIVVSYDQPGSHDVIEGFQESDADWLVSIGMVSEGTNIPRLQVCAYLSNIRTELYFRQVLGRILRINQSNRERCSMFAFAEPKLIEFSERINIDLPNSCVELRVMDFKPSDILTIQNQGIQHDSAEMELLPEHELCTAELMVGAKNKYRQTNSGEVLIKEDAYRTRIISL